MRSGGLESEVKLLSDVVAHEVVLFFVVDQLQLAGEVYHIAAHVVVIFYLVQDHLSLWSCQDGFVIFLSALFGLVSGVGFCEVSIGLDEQAVVFVLAQGFGVKIGPRADGFFLDG